jgi:CBS domain-containing membrane protein
MDMAEVRDIMTRTVTTLAPEDDLVKADAIMHKGRVRHLPVVREDKLVGLISHRDLLRAQIEALAAATSSETTKLIALPAGERMMTNVITVTPDTSVHNAARAMLENKVGCLPVVEDEKLVGIVTESDFVKWSLESAD